MPLSVTVGAYPAAVLTKTPQQLIVEIPAEDFPGQTTIQLASGSNTSAAFPITLQAYAPGIFTTTGNLGSIWHSDGTPVTPKSPAESRRVLNTFGYRPWPHESGCANWIAGAQRSPSNCSDPTDYYRRVRDAC